MGDTESCSSRAFDFSSSSRNRNHRQKVAIFTEVLRRLAASNVLDSLTPGFEDELWAHFCRLPTRYALDVNVERAQDVLMHKRLLQMAHDPATRPALEVRPVQVRFSSDSRIRVEAQWSTSSSLQSIHPPPAFDLTPDLKISIEANRLSMRNWDHNQPSFRPMHEITISTNDKPKLFNQLTSLLSDIGLNIQEAHAFSTVDGYSLDVFLVDGWELEETEQLRFALTKNVSRIESHPRSTNLIYPTKEQDFGVCSIPFHVHAPNDVSKTYDIDLQMLKIEKKIASGSVGDLYKGVLYDLDVAIKLLRNEHLSDAVQREFAQEIDIMRKIQHKNVLRFIGASTKPPSLCIVTEFMSGGNVYDFLKINGVLPLQSLIEVAIDVCEGMNYLHQNNIIHRDLKAANLLMDGNGVVKVSDFGVSRVQAESGVMTAETGTYRWMAPEVIEHKPYDHKADIFSFGIVLWELLTGKLPYENLTPLQAAIGVVHKILRPTIPAHTDPVLAELMERCWHREPSLRPHFSEILEDLRRISERIRDKRRVDEHKEKSSRMSPSFHAYTTPNSQTYYFS